MVFIAMQIWTHNALISGCYKTNPIGKRQEEVIKKQSKSNKLPPIIKENGAEDTVVLKIMSKTETVSISLSILNLRNLLILQLEEEEHQFLWLKETLPICPCIESHLSVITEGI